MAKDKVTMMRPLGSGTGPFSLAVALVVGIAVIYGLYRVLT
jgi:hypothetical protein